MELLPGSSMNNINIDEIPLKAIAHLGDAVYELYIRKKTICMTVNMHKLHQITTSLVNAQFHADLLESLKPDLTEHELSIVNRARNLSLTSNKRRDHTIHRLSTSFEALIGYLYLKDAERLEEIFQHIDSVIEEKTRPYTCNNHS